MKTLRPPWSLSWRWAAEILKPARAGRGGAGRDGRQRLRCPRHDRDRRGDGRRRTARQRCGVRRQCGLASARRGAAGAALGARDRCGAWCRRRRPAGGAGGGVGGCRVAGRCAPAAAPSSRAPVPSRVPAARRPAVETAVRVAWPNAAVGAAEVAAGRVLRRRRGGAAGRAAAGRWRSRVRRRRRRWRSRVRGGGGGACRGGGAGGADVPEGELPSAVAWAVAWAFRQDPVLPRLCHHDRRRLRVRWGGHASCMAVNAVVASNAILRCVMCFGSCGEILKAKGRENLSEVVTNAIDQQTSVRPDCGGFQTGTRIYFSRDTMRDARSFMTYSGAISNGNSIDRVRCGMHVASRCVRYPSAPAAWLAFAVRAPAIRPAFGRVIPPAVAARRARAPAEESRAGISRRAFRRRLGRLPRLDRRIFCRVDRHHIATLHQHALKS